MQALGPDVDSWQLLFTQKGVIPQPPEVVGAGEDVHLKGIQEQGGGGGVVNLCHVMWENKWAKIAAQQFELRKEARNIFPIKKCKFFEKDNM